MHPLAKSKAGVDLSCFASKTLASTTIFVLNDSWQPEIDEKICKNLIMFVPLKNIIINV